jgi:hypothetical protein
MDLPKEEEWERWLTQLETRALRQLLREWRQALAEQWANSNFQSERLEETAVMNAGALGEMKVLNALLDLDYQQLIEGLKDERSSEVRDQS